MINKIIFLYDASADMTVNKRFTTELEEVMKGPFSNLSRPTKIYYLKINSTPRISRERIDEFSCYTLDKAGRSSIKKVSQGLNLREGAELKSCIKYIKSCFLFPTQYLFISCGHGRFAYQDPAFRKQTELKTDSINKFGYNPTDPWVDEKIWNFELADALSGFKVGLGIFYHCYTNLIDSLHAYQSHIPYLISTENFLSNEMLNLRRLVEAAVISDAVYSSEKFRSSIFQVVNTDFQKVVNEVEEMKRATLFLTKSSNVFQLLDCVNKLSDYLIQYSKTDFNWFVDVLIKLKNAYVNTNYGLVDLKILTDAIKERLSLSTEIKKLCDTIIITLESPDFVLYKNTTTSLKSISGISIYLPTLYENGNVYNGYINSYFLHEKAIEIKKRIRWYSFLDEVEISKVLVGRTYP